MTRRYAASRLLAALALWLLLHTSVVSAQPDPPALRLGTALLTAKRPFDQMLYPACGHGIGGAANHVDVYGRIREHFRRHLGGPR